MTGRADELEREATELRRENGWLKEIVMLKGRSLREGDGGQGDDDASEDDSDEDEGAATSSKKGKGKKKEGSKK